MTEMIFTAPRPALETLASYCEQLAVEAQAEGYESRFRTLINVAYRIRNALEKLTLGEAHEKEITRLATIEECARIADKIARDYLYSDGGATFQSTAVNRVASAIRAMKDATP